MQKMKSAWLVTWEWMGDHAAVEEKVAAIINYRKPASYVKDLMEQIYIEKTSTVSEKFSYAKSSKSNPYQARYGDINGVPWRGKIFCGHNPYLYARYVNNIQLQETEDLRGSLIWEERPVPELT